MQIGINMLIIPKTIVLWLADHIGEQLGGAVDDILSKPPLLWTLFRFGQKFIPEHFERTSVPPLPSAAVLFDDVLVGDFHLAPKVVHVQQVGNRIAFVRTDVVYGMADTDMFECGMIEPALRPSATVVQIVRKTQLRIAHRGVVVRVDTSRRCTLDLFGLEPVNIALAKPVDDLQHPCEIRTVIVVVAQMQHRFRAVAAVFQ